MEKEARSKRPIVEMVKVTMAYQPGVPALEEVSMSVAKGEILFLTGASGAGKTTMLKLLYCLKMPDKGMIEVYGRDLARISPRQVQRLRRKIGVAYQDFKLLPELTVFNNIAMAMEVAYRRPRIIRHRISTLLEMLDLSEKRDTPAGNLSRGEQQRVAIARAAANSPVLLLADEPTGNLDPAMSKRVMDLFVQLNTAGTTIIIATHDETILRNTKQRRLILEHGRLLDTV